MKTHKFTTNIKCGGCIATVTPFLEKASEIKKWEVDTNNPGKILTVESEGLTDEKITAIINNAGFKAEPLS